MLHPHYFAHNLHLNWFTPSGKQVIYSLPINVLLYHSKTLLFTSSLTVPNDQNRLCLSYFLRTQHLPFADVLLVMYNNIG